MKEMGFMLISSVLLLRVSINSAAIIGVANMGYFPDYTGNYDVSGTIVVREQGNGIILTGTVVGLPPSSEEVLDDLIDQPSLSYTGNFHIHSGVSCASDELIGGHYYDGLPLDPWGSSYTTDTNGVATISTFQSDFTLSGGVRPVGGRVIIIHDPDYETISCGVINLMNAEVVTMGTYPGISDTDISGTLVVKELDDGISIQGTISGLEASVTAGGIHIHEGFTCTDSSGVGGHFFEDMSEDPWDPDAVTDLGYMPYESDENGNANIDFSMAEFSLYRSYPTAYRAMVVHQASGDRAGCGLIGTANTGIASLGTYPGYTGSLSVSGTVAVANSDSGINIFGTINGLESQSIGGIHIHSGYTCTDETMVGGHYYEGMQSDPWTTTYTSDSQGSAQYDGEMVTFSLSTLFPVAGRALVIHDTSGDRIACSLIKPTTGEVVTIGRYPTYSGNQLLRGTLLVTSLDSSINILGTLGGLEESVTGGIHIHSGYNIGEESGVGGHYYEPLETDPWSTTYTSDGDGYSSVSLVLESFSLFRSLPVAYRAMVVHLSDGTRAGAGIVSSSSAERGAYTTTPSPTLKPTRGPSTRFPSHGYEVEIESSKKKNDTMPPKIIAAIVVPIILFVLIGVALLFMYYSYSKNEKEFARMSSAEASEMEIATRGRVDSHNRDENELVLKDEHEHASTDENVLVPKDGDEDVIGELGSFTSEEHQSDEHQSAEDDLLYSDQDNRESRSTSSASAIVDLGDVYLDKEEV